VVEAEVAGEESGDPRWLDPDERAAWLALSGVLIRLPAALDAQLERDAGLSNFEYLALAMLSETPGRTLRMSQLAVLTNGSLSRLSHVAQRLERQGYIRREQSATDRRSVQAVLTDAGWDKMVATAPGHVAHVRAMVIDALTPAQLAAVRDAAGRILEAVEPGSPFNPAAETAGD
jgi:DNA-binding MarR family transcriptional regulator